MVLYFAKLLVCKKEDLKLHLARDLERGDEQWKYIGQILNESKQDVPLIL